MTLLGVAHKGGWLVLCVLTPGLPFRQCLVLGLCIVPVDGRCG